MEEKVASRSRVNSDVGNRGPSNSLIDQIDRITDGRELEEIWLSFQKNEIKGDFVILLMFVLLVVCIMFDFDDCHFDANIIILTYIITVGTTVHFNA